MRVFPDSDSNVANNWVLYPILSDAYIFNRVSPLLSGNRPSDSDGDATFAITIAVLKRGISHPFEFITKITKSIKSN